MWIAFSLWVIHSAEPWWYSYAFVNAPLAAWVGYLERVRRMAFGVARPGARQAGRGQGRAHPSTASDRRSRALVRATLSVVGTIVTLWYLHLSWARNLGAYEKPVLDSIYEITTGVFVVAGLVLALLSVLPRKHEHTRSIRTLINRRAQSLVAAALALGALLLVVGVRRQILSARMPTSQFTITAAERLTAATLGSIDGELESSAAELRQRAITFFVAGQEAHAAGQYKIAATNFANSSLVLPSSSAYMNEGISWLMAFELTSAERALNSGRARAHSAGNELVEAYFLNNLAAVHHDQDRYDDEFEVAQRAKSLCEKYQQWLCVALSLNRIGDVLYHRNQLSAALREFRNAQSIYRAHDAPLDAKSLENDVANVLVAQGHTRQALEAYELALEAAIEEGDRRGEAKALANIGAIYEGKSEYRNDRLALDYYKRAYALDEAISDWVQQVIHIQHVAVLSDRLGLKEEALAAWQKGFAAATAGTDIRGQAFFMKRLALEARIRDDDGESNRLYQSAEQLYRGIGEVGMAAGVLQEWAGMMLDAGDRAAAIEKYELALVDARALSDVAGEARLTYALGQARPDSAAALTERDLERALVLAASVKDFQTQALASNGLAYLAKERGELSRGIGLLRTALNHCRDFGDPGFSTPMCRSIRESLDGFIADSAKLTPK